jgi:hypothetical protein
MLFDCRFPHPRKHRILGLLDQTKNWRPWSSATCKAASLILNLLQEQTCIGVRNLDELGRLLTIHA